jgi:hypothetical protein
MSKQKITAFVTVLVTVLTTILHLLGALPEFDFGASEAPAQLAPVVLPEVPAEDAGADAEGQ